MKNTKKILSIILSLLLVIGMMSTFAFAEETNASNISIKIMNSNSDVTTNFNIYQILVGNITPKTSASNAEIKDIDWGNAVNFNSSNKVTINNSEYSNDVTGAVNFANSLSNEAYTYDSSASVALATELQKVIDSDKKVTNANSVKQGYYLIIQSDTSSEDATMPATRFMLKAVGTEGITVDISTKKTTEPKPGKEIVNGDNEVDKTVSSAYVGQKIKFKISAKLPEASTYDAYESYKITLKDTLPAGLTYDVNDESFKVYYVEKKGSYENVLSEKKLFVEKNDDTSATGYIKLFKEFENILSISLDAKELKIPAEATIYVEYTATLNENATVGNVANENEMVIIYPQKPNSDTTVETTDKGKAEVYTGNIVITKVDGVQDSIKLSGAVFTVMKEVDSTKYYLNKNDKGEISWTEESKVSNAENDSNVFKVTTDENGKAIITGLAAGTYYLREIKAPENYNLLKSDVKITLSLSNDSDDTNLKIMTYENSIVNHSGAELPETGGIGTTIFYIAGAILVIGAGVVFVTRRRMHSDN